MKEFKIQMNEIMPEIKDKTWQMEQSIRERANLTDISLSLNRTIREINIQVSVLFF
jgi:hypothetical protein